MERIFNNVKITSSFEIPETRENLVSGETIGQHFGKIAKVINDLENGEFSSKTTIDAELSDTSTNPVQNKVVKQAIDNKADKSLYGDSTINVGRKADSDVGEYSTAEGYNTTASGGYSHAEGEYSTASGYASHAEGSNSNLKGILPDRTVTISDVDYTITGSTAYGMNSHAEGTQSFAYGYSSHAEGYNTTASGSDSHAEGYNATASGHNSHAEGVTTTASGSNSHAEGNGTKASGNCSHAGGYYTKALKESEFAHGKYNQSNDDTLFSIGDGTADDARHNAFEITTDGGKLHDKDIATTDLIPTSLPANGGNADTVDNLHADDFVNATDFNHIQIPSNVDVPAWIYENGKRYQRYMTNSVNIGLTNVPDNSTDYVWYWYDGLNIFARVYASGKYFICDMINGVFSGWKDVYTSGYKPYVTGDATVAANSTTCTSNHGFTPSAAIWWDGNMSGVAVSFNETQFTINNTSTVDRRVYYLIFK